MLRSTVVAALCVLVAGCGPVVRSVPLNQVAHEEATTQVTEDGQGKAQKSQAGMIYFLPKAMLRFKIEPSATKTGGGSGGNSTATTTTVVNVYSSGTQSSDSKDKSAGGHTVEFSYKDYDGKDKSVTLDMVYAIDPNAAYYLNYVPSPISDDDVTLTVKDNFISEVATTTEDRSRDIAKQSVELVKQAVLLGAGGLNPLYAPRGIIEPVETPKEVESTPSALEIDIDPVSDSLKGNPGWCDQIEAVLAANESNFDKPLFVASAEERNYAFSLQRQAEKDVRQAEAAAKIKSNEELGSKVEADRANKEYGAAQRAEAQIEKDVKAGKATEEALAEAKKDTGNKKVALDAADSRKDAAVAAAKAAGEAVKTAQAAATNARITAANARKAAKTSLDAYLVTKKQATAGIKAPVPLVVPKQQPLLDLYKHSIALCIKGPTVPLRAVPANAEKTKDGIYYRTVLPYKMTLLAWEAGSLVRKIERIVMLPNESPTYLFDMKRSALVKKTYDVKFENGFLTSAKINKPSEWLAGVSLPVDILKGIASIPAELIQLKFNYNSNQQALLDAEKAKFDSLKAFNDSVLAMYQANAAQTQALIDQFKAAGGN